MIVIESRAGAVVAFAGAAITEPQVFFVVVAELSPGAGRGVEAVVGSDH